MRASRPRENQAGCATTGNPPLRRSICFIVRVARFIRIEAKRGSAPCRRSAMVTEAIRHSVTI